MFGKNYYRSIALKFLYIYISKVCNLLVWFNAIFSCRGFNVDHPSTARWTSLRREIHPSSSIITILGSRSQHLQTNKYDRDACRVYSVKRIYTVKLYYMTGYKYNFVLILWTDLSLLRIQYHLFYIWNMHCIKLGKPIYILVLCIWIHKNKIKTVSKTH